MPAHDLVTLFTFEPQIESVVATILEGWQVDAVRQQGQTDTKTPRVEVKLMLGAPTGARYLPPGAQTTPAQTYPRAWNAQLVLSIFTNRRTPVGNADRHGEMVGKCRVAMLQAQGTLNASLEFLHVQTVADAGVIPTIDAGQDIDITPLVFTVQFSIRDSAWPDDIAGRNPASVETVA